MKTTTTNHIVLFVKKDKLFLLRKVSTFVSRTNVSVYTYFLDLYVRFVFLRTININEKPRLIYHQVAKFGIRASMHKVCDKTAMTANYLQLSNFKN